MPKSSSAMRTPSARNACSVASTWSLFSSSSVSVISSSSRRAGRPVCCRIVHHDREQISADGTEGVTD